MSTTDTFERRAVEQRAEALRRANEIRLRRAALKRAVGAGRAPLAPLIVDPPDWLHSMRLLDLLMALPQWGSQRAGRLLRGQAIALDKTVGGLSQRQRQALVSVLGGERAARTERG